MTPLNLDTTAAFKALGDPTRQQILGLLSKREMSIAEVADQFEMSRTGVKKHLNLLEKGRLIRVRVEGRERYNALNKDGFSQVQDWLKVFDQFWDDKLAALKAAAETDAKIDVENDVEKDFRDE